MTPHKHIKNEAEARCGYQTPTKPETAFKHSKIEQKTINELEIYLDPSNAVFEAENGLKTDTYLG